MWERFMRTSGLLGLAVVVCIGCADGPSVSAQQQAWLDEYGAQGPFPTTGPASKADSTGRPGPPSAWDNDDYQVWEIRNQWSGITDESGLAWSARSGLNWDEKYAVWLESLEVIEQPDTPGKKTFLLTTPEGQRLIAPVLECAEVAIFLRATFAAWYGLPFYLEASDKGKPIYLGHFGFRNHQGQSFGNAPRFRTRYRDYSSEWSSGSAWPVDEKLRKRGLYGGGDEVSFLEPVNGNAARAGAYFDRIYLNKRVGHFMLLALSWFGSMHLADGANMFHIRAADIRAGDVLLLRWQRQGIGHTVPVMRVDELEENRLELAVATGSMPRRYPKWEEGSAAGRYFKGERAGGFGENDEGDAYAKLGGGLRRWRVAVSTDGRYRNTFLEADSETWINSSNHEAIAQRTADFESLLKELTPEDKRELALNTIASARDHLRNYPASCSARIKREEAFDQLYEVNDTHFWMNRDQTDATHRILDDYVFAELVYSESRTCCWNSSTPAMYDLIMAYTESTLLDASARACVPPQVFMATAITTENDGFDDFRRYANDVGQGGDWVPWSADEDCPQAQLNTEDVPVTSTIVPWCSLETVVNDDPGCGDTGTLSQPTQLSTGTYSGLRICTGEADHWSYTGSGDVEIDVEPIQSDALLQVMVYDVSGGILARSPSAGRQPIDPSEAQLEPIRLTVSDGETVTIKISERGPASGIDYTLKINDL